MSVLAGLARNPAVPEELLVRLARDRRAAREMSLHRSALSDAVAGAILAHGDDDLVFHLHPPCVSAAMWERITARGLTAFPDFVRAMVARDVPLDIEDLELAYRQPRSVLVQDPDPQVRRAVASSWWEMPEQTLVDFLGDPEPAVREAAVRQRRVPAEWEARCLTDPATRSSVAAYAQLNLPAARELASDPDKHVRVQLARNPGLPAEVVALLVADPAPFVYGQMAQHPQIDAVTRNRLYERLAVDTDADARTLRFFNLSTPDWVADLPLPARLTYLDSPYVPFRLVLAGSSGLPAEVWDQLDRDPAYGVRRAAATRPDAPPEVLHRLALEHKGDKPYRDRLVDHPNFPRAVLPSFAEAADPRTRCLACADDGLAPELLSRLAGDPDPQVRLAVAGHGGLHDRLFDRLLGDDNDEVAEAAAANPALPVPRMRRILNDAAR